MEKNTDNTFSNITIMPDNPAEPGNSGRAVKDIPGKETNQPLTKILLAGTPDAGGGCELHEEEHQEVQHGQGTQLGQDQQASPFLPAELVDLTSPLLPAELVDLTPPLLPADLVNLPSAVLPAGADAVVKAGKHGDLGQTVQQRGQQGGQDEPGEGGEVLGQHRRKAGHEQDQGDGDRMVEWFEKKVFQHSCN
jgi:hypothetical protein